VSHNPDITGIVNRICGNDPESRLDRIVNLFRHNKPYSNETVFRAPRNKKATYGRGGVRLDHNGKYVLTPGGPQQGRVGRPRGVVAGRGKRAPRANLSPAGSVPEPEAG
jgi:hypothetical protein